MVIIMDLFEAIEKRATYRGKYKDEKVKKEHLDMILHAAINAPSGANKQTTSFIVVEEPIMLKKAGDNRAKRRYGYGTMRDSAGSRNSSTIS